VEKILDNKPNNPQQLNIALLIDSFEVYAWEYSMLCQILKEKYANISLIILNKQVKEKNNTSKYVLYNWFLKYQTKKYKLKNNAFSSANAQGLFTDIPVISIGDGTTLLKGKATDLIIRLGFNEIPKSIFEMSRFGIFTHHKETEGTLSTPDGFWDVIHKTPTTKTKLYLLSDYQSDTPVVCESQSSTHDVSVNHNMNTAYWKASLFIPRVLKQLHNAGLENIGNSTATKVKSTGSSIANLSFFFSLIKYFFNFTKHKISKKLTKENWILLYNLEDTNVSTYDFQKYKKLIPPKGVFWADPFIIEKNDKFYLFLEACGTKIGAKGIISVIEMDKEGNYKPPTTILQKDYHLSYPFMFEWENDLYMIPETGQNATIELYKCTDFPLQWEFQYNLMENVMAYDSTLFFHDNKWWLFANMKQNKEMSSWDELYLFHADSPVSKTWTPHPLNPIISDVTRARPAGNIFMKDGKVYRPSQNSAYKYGYGLKINKIVNLTETDYEEITIESIEPNWDKSITTIHTYNKVGALTLIDGILKQ